MKPVLKYIKPIIYIILLLFVVSILMFPGFYFQKNSASTSDFNSDLINSTYLNTINLSNKISPFDTVFVSNKNKALVQAHKIMYLIFGSEQKDISNLFSPDFEVVTYGTDNQVFSIPWSIWKSMIKSKNLPYVIGAVQSDSLIQNTIHVKVHLINKDSDFDEVIDISMQNSSNGLPLVSRISLYQADFKINEPDNIIDNQNNIESLVLLHKWFGQLESDSLDTLMIEAFFANDFELRFLLRRKINELSNIAIWHHERIQPLEKVNYSISNIRTTNLSENNIALTFLCRLEAKNIDGDYIDIYSNQEWEVVKEAERFKIKSIKEELVTDWFVE